MVPSPLCDFCGRSRVVLPSPSLSDQPKIELDEKIAAQIAKSAGAIYRTVPPYQSIIDNTTVWQSGDRTTVAFVSPNGTIQLHPRL